MAAQAYIVVLICLLNSRGAIAALAVVILAVAYSGRHHLRRLAKPGLVVLGGTLIAVAAVASLSLLKPGYAAGFLRHASELSDASFQNRSQIWPTGLWALAQQPLLGVGPGQAGHIIASHNQLGYEPALVFNNTYVTWIAELGLVGILAFLPLVWILLRYVRNSLQRELKPHHAAYALVLVAYAVQISTYEAGLNLRFWGVIGLSLAAFRINQNGRQGSAKPTIPA